MLDRSRLAIALLYAATAVAVGAFPSLLLHVDMQVTGIIGITVLLASEAVAVLAQTSSQRFGAVRIAGAFSAATLGCVAAGAFDILLLRGSVALSIGYATAVAAIALRWLARMHLGSSFTYDIVEPLGGALVTRGIYAHVRHPSYLGTHLGLISVGLLAGSGVGLVLSIAALPLTILRIRREEHLLERRFGEEFRAYRSRTRALVPLVW